MEEKHTSKTLCHVHLTIYQSSVHVPAIDMLLEVLKIMSFGYYLCLRSLVHAVLVLVLNLILSQHVYFHISLFENCRNQNFISMATKFAKFSFYGKIKLAY